MERGKRNWEGAEHYLRALEDPWYATISLLQHEVTVHATRYWDAIGLRTLHLPLTTGAVSSPMGLGSDSVPVQIELDGRSTYLADSMQFLLEWGCRLHEPGCFYLMPSFRGEEIDATHLSQFFHLEAELPTDLDGVLDAVDGYLVDLAGHLLASCTDQVHGVAGDVAHLERLANSEGCFVRLTFAEAVRQLRDTPDAVSVLPGTTARTLTRAGEQALLAELGDFVWVTGWDHLAVPFYQAFADAEHRTAANGDLLFGVGEVVGAGERHTAASDLEEALAMHAVEPQRYGWYQRMKEVRPMRTAGFGIGVERLLLWVSQHKDIRDMQLVPRFRSAVEFP